MIAPEAKRQESWKPVRLGGRPSVNGRRVTELAREGHEFNERAMTETPRPMESASADGAQLTGQESTQEGATKKMLSNEQYPMFDRLQRLPIDHPGVVFRAPGRFGSVAYDSSSQTTVAEILRRPSALTRPEKLRMVRFEGNCATSKANFHD